MAMTNRHFLRDGIYYIELKRRNAESLWVMVDEKDFHLINRKGSWVCKWNETARTWYARHNGYTRQHLDACYMHRAIMRVTDPQILVDHADHCGLNNLRSNLSISDKQLNGFNRRGCQTNTKSRHRNVYWNKRENQWMVWVVRKGKRYYGGYFVNLPDAVEAATKLRMEAENGR